MSSPPEATLTGRSAGILPRFFVARATAEEGLSSGEEALDEGDGAALGEEIDGVAGE